MLASFLSDCRGVTVRKRHIQRFHIESVKPTGSFFVIPIGTLVTFIHDGISQSSGICYRREGLAKITVWFDYQSTVGICRKHNAETTYLAVIIKKRNGWATVATAYPDVL
jgi:hypothetical protein